MEKGAILVGEPMGLFIAQEEGELSDVSGYSMAVAGAEFNVAVGLARLNQLFQRTFHRLYAEKQSQHR